MNDSKPPTLFTTLVISNLKIGLLLLLIGLIFGILGYYYIAHFSFIDALHNASMILSGMGPVVTITNTNGKLFSSFYAIFCALFFLIVMGFIVAPFLHHFIRDIHYLTNNK